MENIFNELIDEAFTLIPFKCKPPIQLQKNDFHPSASSNPLYIRRYSCEQTLQFAYRLLFLTRPDMACTIKSSCSFVFC